MQIGVTLPFLKATGWSFDAAASEQLPRIGGRAKSVILIWLWGAPSHIDLFDPKPDAPPEIRGPFAPIATRTPGLKFTELLPRLANRSHLFTVVRSHVMSSSSHSEAGTLSLTGCPDRPGPVQPSFGSIVAKHRGHRGGHPPFIALGQGIPRDVLRAVDGWGGGTLGHVYDPFLVTCREEGRAEIPDLGLLDGLTPNRVNDRRSLLALVDKGRRKLDDDRESNWGRIYERAYDLLTVPNAAEIFDLTRETNLTREEYGQTSFGQSCLLARRLVEASIPFVHVNWSQYAEPMMPGSDFGWDTHIYNFDILPDRHCPILDRAISALLDDLHRRNLLSTTLIVIMGEFGRTPKINHWAARDHWPFCYSSIWAGAGISGGRTVGQSDRLGEHPVTPPITPLMVGTTIAELAGIGPQARAEMGVLSGGSVVDEIMA